MKRYALVFIPRRHAHFGRLRQENRSPAAPVTSPLLPKREGGSYVRIRDRIHRAFLLGAVIFSLLGDSPSRAYDVVSKVPPGMQFGPSSHGLALSIFVARTSFNVGAPIPLTVAIKNDGPPVGISRSENFADYVWDVTDSNGKRLSQVPTGHNEIVGNGGPRPVDATHTYINHYHLGYNFDLSPGTYRVKATAILGVAVSGKWRTYTLTSNELVIHISR